MKSGSPSKHFTTDDQNISLSCNQLCVSLAIAKILEDKVKDNPLTEAEGTLRVRIEALRIAPEAPAEMCK